MDGKFLRGRIDVKRKKRASPVSWDWLTPLRCAQPRGRLKSMAARSQVEMPVR